MGHAGRRRANRVVTALRPVATPAHGHVDTAQALTERAATAGWHGPDPYDGLWSRWPRPLVAGRRRRQVIVQLHARAPIDIRRLYRRRHPRLAKTLALFGVAALRGHRLTGRTRLSELAADALEMLSTDHRAGTRAWGYPFDVQTRWSFYPAGTANVVVTAFAADALLEAATDGGRADFALRAREAARWILEETWVEDGGFFAYHPDSRVSVHNASLLGAALVHATLEDDTHARDCVRRAVDRAVSAQRSDGSWAYGEGPGLHWVDSFHTGYVLLSLARLRGIDPRVDEALGRGARYYHLFFDHDGRARLWPRQSHPEDAHAAGTGLSTLAMLAKLGHVDHTLVANVAGRVLSAGIRGGRAVARRYRWGRTTVWYPRWCDGHVARGLVDVAAVEAQRATALA